MANTEMKKYAGLNMRLSALPSFCFAGQRVNVMLFSHYDLISFGPDGRHLYRNTY